MSSILVEIKLSLPQTKKINRKKMVRLELVCHEFPEWSVGETLVDVENEETFVTNELSKHVKDKETLLSFLESITRAEFFPCRYETIRSHALTNGIDISDICWKETAARSLLSKLRLESHYKFFRFLKNNLTRITFEVAGDMYDATPMYYENDNLLEYLWYPEENDSDDSHMLKLEKCK
jgi:hypothetical protein